MERKLLRRLLCCSRSLAVVNEGLDYIDRKKKPEIKSTGKRPDGNVGSSVTQEIVTVWDGAHRSRQERERKRQISLNYRLRNMCGDLKGIWEDKYYVMSSNLKTRKVSGFMKRSYQECRKEWEGRSL